MKKFLEDLKKELQKRNFSSREITEILADHQEMIETAQSEGLTDEELEGKFGHPAKLAEDLLENNEDEAMLIKNGGNDMKGYELFKEFSVTNKEFDIHLQLVADDVKYEVKDQEKIEVYYKKISNIEDYECTFDNNAFELKTKQKVKIGWTKNSGEFIVYVPQGVVSNTVIIQSVSGDFELQSLHTKELTLKTTSGDLEICDFTVEKANFSTVSGDVELRNGNMETLEVSMVSGDVECKHVKCLGEVNINTVSGDFQIENCHFGPTSFKSVSGDLEGEDFYPKSIALRSVSGDVNIMNQDKSFVIDINKKKTLSGDVNIN